MRGRRRSWDEPVGEWVVEPGVELCKAEEVPTRFQARVVVNGRILTVDPRVPLEVWDRRVMSGRVIT